MRGSGAALVRARHAALATIAVVVFTTIHGLAADRADDLVKARMEAFRLPGLAVAVVKDGQIVKAAGYGVADRDRQIPVTTETVFKIGSVSKQFVAAAIMVLAQNGRLTVDDRVSTFLEGAPASWRGITIRHLLTHTSGLVRESPAFSPFRIQRDADLIRATYAAPLAFVPGTKWQYSNVGYIVLAEIIRMVSGQPWEDFIAETVLRPAGLNATVPTTVKTTDPRFAVGYTGDDNRQAAQDWPAVRASGAFLSTVLDLAKWDAVLQTETVLSETTRQQMWTPVRLRDGTTAPYGFGWHVFPRGRRGVWHGGGLPGFSAYVARFLNDRLTVVTLANGDDVDLPSIAIGVANLYLRD